MKLVHRLLIAVISAGVLTTHPVLADPPPGKGNSNKSGQGNSGQGNSGQGQGNSGQGQGNSKNDASNTGAALVAAGITAVAARNLALNAGVVGYAPLPPGIAKNLARGKPLPPGIAKKYVPGSILGQLPRHEGYEWRVAGSDLILVAIGTAVVADILRNVFQ
ncbi:MAG: hypothetical protein IT507_08780 [Burkholderiaceae bacterium]|nr:hypothetical protein [Burkholderiaceae bacterium]